MNLQSLINGKFSSLTDSDRRILEVILTFNFDKNIRVTDIAKKAHVSTTSVHRTIKKLGFSAYTEFKYAMKNTTTVPENIVYSESIVNNIEDTLALYYREDYTSLYKLFASTNTIYTYGTGNEQLNALKSFAHHIMYYTNKPITQLTTLSDLEFASRKIQKNDLIMICSLHGNTESYQGILNTLLLKEVPIVSITGHETNALSSNATHQVYFIPDFHASLTNLHFPAITLNVVLDTLIHEIVEYISKK